MRYLLPRALAAGADILLAGSATQSDWCRRIGATATRFELDTFLMRAGGVKADLQQGNLLLDRIIGAETEIIEDSNLDEGLDAELEIRGERMRRVGRWPFVLDGGDNDVCGALAAVDAMAELDGQLESMGDDANRLPCRDGGTRTDGTCRRCQ